MLVGNIKIYIWENRFFKVILRKYLRRMPGFDNLNTRNTYLYLIPPYLLVSIGVARTQGSNYIHLEIHFIPFFLKLS